MNVRHLIIGAGPTGLGAAWRLAQRGIHDWLLLEAGQVPGGLAQSVVDEHGFTWDLGGHVQFSHYEMFDQLMDDLLGVCLLYTSPSPRDGLLSRMPSSA